MPWVYLFIAGLLEIGWPIGFKMSENESTRVVGIIASIICMAGSGILLWLAQRSIPMGTAYAIWTGIGTVGTFIAGVLLYNDAASVGRIVGAFLIVAGVIILKLASPT